MKKMEKKVHDDYLILFSILHRCPNCRCHQTNKKDFLAFSRDYGPLKQNWMVFSWYKKPMSIKATLHLALFRSLIYLDFFLTFHTFTFVPFKFCRNFLKSEKLAQPLLYILYISIGRTRLRNCPNCEKLMLSYVLRTLTREGMKRSRDWPY